MKVLFTISCLSYGGAEKNMVLIANYLSQKGHSVAICNFNERETKQNIHPQIRRWDMPATSPKHEKFGQTSAYRV